MRVRFGLSARERPLATRMYETWSAWECSAHRDVHIVLHTNKTHPKRRYYLFYFNLNLYLLTLALENLYFNTLDLEKVQAKSLGCIKSQGETCPAYCTPTLQGATAEGRKSRMWLASRGLPTPVLGDLIEKGIARKFYLSIIERHRVEALLDTGADITLMSTELLKELLTCTDSNYGRLSFTCHLTGWKRNGFKTANNKPVKHQELFQASDAIVTEHDMIVYWKKVRGHSRQPGKTKT